MYHIGLIDIGCLRAIRHYEVGAYSSKPFQIASAVLKRISFPSRSIRSQTLNTVSLGRHVENNVKNHCIVNTLVNGGSKLVPTEKHSIH